MRYLKPVTLFCAICLALCQSAQAVDLYQVYQQSNKSSPWLKQYKATLDAQNAGANANLSNMLPVLNITASAGVTDFGGVSYQQNTTSVTLTQNIMNVNAFGTYSVSRTQANAQSDTYQSQSEQFIYQIAQAYFNVLEAQDILRFDLAQEAFLYRAQLEAQQKLDVGTGTIIDYKQALANYDAAVAQVIADKNNLSVSYEQLTVYTGVKYTKLSRLRKDFPFEFPKPKDIHYWERHALRHNYDLAAQRKLSHAAKQNIEAAFGNQSPVLQLVGTYTHQNNNAPAAAFPFNGFNNLDTLSIGLQVTWNIFQGGGLVASTIQAAKNYNAQLENQDLEYRTVRKMTRQDYLRVGSQLAQVKAYQQAVVSGEASLKQYYQKYQVGTETIVNVLDQLQQLYQSKENLAQAKYDYILSLLKLKQDAGELNSETIRSLSAWLEPPKFNKETL